MMELYLVRHGQSEANAAHILQGAKIDTPLTKQGRHQAVTTKERFKGIRFDRFFASPLRRAGETAMLVAGPSATVTLDPRLVEFDYGQWDGQQIEQLLSEYPEYFRDESHFRNAWQISGGERYEETERRLKSFMDSLRSLSYERVLIVSHGMTIKLWIAFLLGIQYPERIAEPANASFTRITFQQDRPILKTFSG